MSGELKRAPLTHQTTVGAVPERMATSMSSSASPLKIFGNAKKRIRDIFIDISSYIEETKQFTQSINDDQLLSASECASLSDYIHKVSGIRDVLARDHMKVVFFGRTSNGKSTVINSMLRSKILPSGIGHTTHCFVQVEGSDSHDDGYLLLEGSQEKKSVHSLKELANSLSKVKLPENALIRICWPKNKCSLLKDDVVLVDSPGIDVSPNLDLWIDKFCLDADVFVLVANAESTLMQTEKNFFLKVSDRLSKPTVFILNNRWDASASEPEMMEMVKGQHMERNMEFLCNELKVVSAQEAEDRIFFVSAREALHQRLTESGATTTPLGSMLEGYQSRLFDFANFERKFEECISRSAVKTKFAQHAHKGKLMVSELKEVMGSLLEKCRTLRDEIVAAKSKSNDQLTKLERRLQGITTEVQTAIQSITDDVQLKVARALSEEIQRLYELVDEFNRPFHSDPVFLDVYKRELYSYVESRLGNKIQERCSSALGDIVHHTEQRMTDKMGALLSDEKRKSLWSHFNAQDRFTVEYKLDARNLCSEFREDIEFRFSFSPASMLSRYLGRDVSITALCNRPSFIERNLHSTPPPPFPSSSVPDETKPSASQPSSSSTTTAPAPAQPTTNTAVNQRASNDGDVALAILRLAPAISSTSAITVLSVAGLIIKGVGWRVFAVVGGAYGLLYCYERVMWSNRAKERAFKSQYVSFASSKLRLLVDMTSANASHQVQQELSSTFSRLKHDVNMTKTDIEADIKQMDNELKLLEETGSRAKLLRNKAGWLDNELNDFISRYIEHA